MPVLITAAEAKAQFELSRARAIEKLKEKCETKAIEIEKRILRKINEVVKSAAKLPSMSTSLTCRIHKQIHTEPD